MDFQEVIKTRRSVRSYSDRDIEEGVLQRVMEGACSAPSANNVQPWRFIVVRDAAKRGKLGELAAGQAFVGQAPCVIACCGKRYVDRYSWIGERMYIVDVTIAIDHLTLSARNEGLGTCWIGAFDHEPVRKLLDVPDGYDVVMLIPIGYPTSESAFRGTGSRKSLGDTVFSEKFSR